MNLKPIGERVLVEIKLTEEKTAGGILIPQTSQEKTQEGKVLAIGDAQDKIKVKVGDHIIYDKYAGTQIKINDKDCLIIKADDILAIVN